MNSSYTIALFVAIALCGIILGYHFFSDRTQPHQGDAPIVAQNVPSGDASRVTSDSGPSSGSTGRATLRSDSPISPPPPARPIAPPPPAPGDSAATGPADMGQGSQPRVPAPTTPVTPAPGDAVTPPPADPRSVLGDASTPPARPAGANPPPQPVNNNPNNIPRTGRGSLVHNPPQSGPTYTIQSGDTFASIAREKLGSEGKYHLIAEANPFVDPRKLKVGQVIRLPDAGHPASNPPSGSAPASNDTAGRDAGGAGPTEYTVQGGDTLSRIARVHYGDPNLWEVIYLANKDKIGSDPANIKVGMKLFIPPEPRAAH